MHDDKVKAALAAMRARCDAATPGPWAPSDQTRGGPVTSAWVESLPDDTIVIDSHGTAFAFGVNVCAVPPFDADKAAADTSFIAAARTDLPKLLAVAEACAAMAEANEAGDMVEVLRGAERMVAALAALGEP